MFCQNCGKNEATIKYTQIINGKKTEVVLCNICGSGVEIQDMPINISNFFESMLDIELKCSLCNLEYNEFMKSGKFGCSNCYNIFENKIASILKKIHGDNTYLGRTVGRSSAHPYTKVNANNVGAHDCARN
ncbi:MAG: hypothetical protein FWC68_00070 [Oscillospiraceae bacterium]|nr:hypothetical protein [Oscillospiraceae bacterium]